MSLLTRYFEQRGVVNLTHPRDPALAELFGARDASSGVQVNERTAVGWTALSSGVRLKSETIASLPIDVLRRLEPRGRKPLPSHPVAALLAHPNPEMTSFEFRDLMGSQMYWWGNAYAQIIWDARGIPVELWPLSADRVTIDRDLFGNLIYRISLPSEPFAQARSSATLPADEVLHIRGWTRYGLLGERMTKVYREAIGLGLVTELFGSLFFGQGANAGGFFEHPAQLSVEAQGRLLKQKENQASGVARAHRLFVLEEGMKFHQMTIEPDKAQFLGLRKFQVTEASRMIRVPPHFLYDLERATFSNIEHQAIEFVTYSMAPDAVRWEQRLGMQLLGPKDRVSTYIKFNMNALLRGDMAARMQFYATGIQHGIFSPNDAREYEDLNPVAGGDTYLAPTNLTPVKFLAASPPKTMDATQQGGTDDDEGQDEPD